MEISAFQTVLNSDLEMKQQLIIIDPYAYYESILIRLHKFSFSNCKKLDNENYVS